MVMESLEDKIPVCGNCFWRDYCTAHISFLHVNSVCFYNPSAFEPMFHRQSRAIRALPEGSREEKLPETFFTRVGDDFELDGVCSDKLELATKYLIIDALIRNNWQQKNAAHYLGISQRRMNYYVAKFGIRHSQWGKYHDRLREDADDATEPTWEH